MRRLLGREPRRRVRSGSRRRGRRPTSTATGVPVPSRFADESELLELCDEVSRHPCSALEFIPGLGDFTEAEGELMGRMSAAADRPLNWNVLVVIAGIAERVRTQLAASDRAAELGGRVLGLTIPTTVRPRLSFASGFLLDTIPGWQGPMTEPHADKLARLRSPEAARRAAGRRRRRPARAWPTSASTSSPSARARRPSSTRDARWPTWPPSSGSTRSTRCATSPSTTTCARASRSRPTATTRPTGRPGSTSGATRGPSSAPPTPGPTSTSWPRSTTRRCCCAGRWSTSGCCRGRRPSRS